MSIFVLKLKLFNDIIYVVINLKVGYVTVVGKPNAGKSTLVNEIVGYKVAITTPKPQTTRYNIRGIYTSNDSQIIFTDTPGIHIPKHKMGEYMMEGVKNALESNDEVLYLVDATKSKIDSSSENIMSFLAKTNSKVFLIITKIDKVKKEKILEIIKDYNDYFTSTCGKFTEIIPISTYKKDGINELINLMKKYLDDGEKIYEDDEITDLTMREIAEEIIREKALNNLDEEVPHGLKVEVENFKECTSESGKYEIKMDVNIICNKLSHKSIIIGKDGTMLNKIINEAKKDLGNMFEANIKIKAWVKVRQNWQKQDIYLNDIRNRTK